MNDSFLLDLSSPLSMRCPHCGHLEVDDFEVLTEDEVHCMRCCDCAAAYHVIVTECSGCRTESVFTWKDEPTPEAIATIACLACGQHRHEDEEDSPTGEFLH
jgi:transcription elongation factor Elf1